MMLRSIVLVLAFCSTACGQFLETPRSAELGRLARIHVTDVPQFARVRVRSLAEYTLVESVETQPEREGYRTWVWTPPSEGRYLVIADTFDPEAGIGGGEYVVVVGQGPPPGPTPPGPGPDPQPEPDPQPPEVPADRFDNVGRLSFQSGQRLYQQLGDRGGIPTIAATAKLYLEAADRYESGAFPSYSAAQSWLSTERLKAWGPHQETWKATWLLPIAGSFAKHITAESNRRDIVDFLRAVGVGLGAVR